MLQMANIREHNAWVHTDREKATFKARELINAAVNRVSFHEPLAERLVDINPATLVIGGGVSGMSAALEIADTGKQVFLIEKEEHLGGHLADIDLIFPNFSSAQQKIKPLIERVEKHQHIDVYKKAQIDDISGYIGNFEANVAINSDEFTLEFGNIIVAVGLKTWDPSPIEEYGYGKLPDVITSAEFEKMLKSGEIVKKDGQTPNNIAIIHCVGSRNSKYNSYCSRVCCTTALKYANQIRSALPDSNIYELYADMRSMAKGCEELYTITSRKRVMFLMFDQENKLPRIKKAAADDASDMLIELDEVRTRKQLEIPADMVILMTAMDSREETKKVAHATGVSLCGNKFFIEKHPKLDPVATTTAGVYIVGSCQGPKEIPDSVSQSRAASARVLGAIHKGKASVEVTTAFVEATRCCACKMCIEVCPYIAISFDEKRNASTVNGALCQGCGACVALCRPKAIDIKGSSQMQVMAELNALFTPN
jgi:heterodisulfide reductase subunit A